MIQENIIDTKTDILDHWDSEIWSSATRSKKECMAFMLANRLIFSQCVTSDTQRQNIESALSVMENELIVAIWMRVSTILVEDPEKIKLAHDLFVDDVLACYGVTMQRLHATRQIAPRTPFTPADGKVFDDQGNLHKIVLEGVTPPV